MRFAACDIAPVSSGAYRASGKLVKTVAVEVENALEFNGILILSARTVGGESRNEFQLFAAVCADC